MLSVARKVLLSITSLNQLNGHYSLLLSSLYWHNQCWVKCTQKLRIPTPSSSKKIRSVPRCQETHGKKCCNIKESKLLSGTAGGILYLVEIPGLWQYHQGPLLQLCPLAETLLLGFSWAEPEAMIQQGEQPPRSRRNTSAFQAAKLTRTR